MSAKVKRRRRYDSARRQAGAERRRAAVVDAANRLFVRDGFAATTIAKIAEDAGVSEEMVYKAFGNKVALVRAIRDKALAGVEPVHAEHRSDRMQASQTDPRAIIRGWGVLTMEVAPRVAPVLLLVRDAAASDPELARLQEEMDASRLTRMTHNARTLLKAGHLRDGITLDAATDVLWTYSSPELYELLVIRRRWSVERYGRFIADAMIGALLPSSSPSRMKPST
jgi:AcrR family transcriptional regulator